jgi:glycosyltransferase involved in cell wall biosynthesis
MCAAGVPWVASPRPEYARLHAAGAGILADRPRTWYRELKRLRESPALREELSQAGREVAATNRLEDHAWRWHEAWEKAYELQRGVRTPSVIGV